MVREQLINPPSSLAERLALLQSLYPDRVVILPDAFRSAKGFQGDKTEEWAILQSVATVLWNLCFESEGGDWVSQEYKRQTGYDLALTESKSTRTNPNLMQLRKRQYNGSTIDISPHIKGRNSKVYFRLHFYVDTDNRKIVIGHAGGHMKTAGTRRVSF